MRKVLAIATALLVLAGGIAPVAAASPATDASSASATPTDAGTGFAPASVGDDYESSSDNQSTDASNERPPSDPSSDVLGWEEVNGYGIWYNESINVDRSNGLNSTELDKVVARGMARVEVVRQLEFEKSVPVEVISRSEYKNETSGRFSNISEQDRLHQNVKWEAMMMVGEDTDALGVQQSNTGATVGGYYSPREERIVIVSNNESSPKMNEITLSQELFHALQDQRFNLSKYDQSTEETHNAVDGIIEGDGNYVDQLYSKRCEAEWDCLMPQPDNSSGGGTSSIHFGMYLVSYQPYSDGPKFVKEIHQEKGWEGVNAVYDDPPASTEQTIHPEKYGSDQPANMTFTDRSNDEWRILDLGNGSKNYAIYGEAGLATMLFYPFYDSGRTKQPIISTREFFNLTAGGSVSSFDPISYGNSYTNGWDGDRLYPYVTDDSAETNETGYVWKTVWDSERDAKEFADGYRQLLKYYGAESVQGHENTYRIPDDRKYNDAFYFEQSGKTVVLVNAPSVDELSAVRSGAAPEVEQTTTTTSDDTTTTESTTGDDSTTTTSDDGSGDTDATTTTQSQPGFGVVVALVALLAAALFAATRRRE